MRLITLIGSINVDMAPKFRFFILAAYVSALYLLLPYGRGITALFREHNLLRDTISGGTVLLLGAVAVQAQRRFQAPWLRVGSVFFGIGTFYAVLFTFIQVPEERLHFIEYGLLSPLAIYTLTPYFRGWRLYVFSTALAGLFGAGDEYIQYLLPNRVFEWKDIYFNVSAAVLGTVFYLIGRKIILNGLNERIS